jgi:RimJ/RimL family protein N-acetyltransferase
MNGGDDRALTPLTVEVVEHWYARLAAERFGWVIEIAGRCAGVARLPHYDVVNRRAEFAIGIFDPALWNQGYGTEATRLVLRYAFGELRLHRVGLFVLDENARAQALYAKCGFTREGIVRDSVLIAGQWHSDIAMSILEDEYRAAARSW